MCQRSTTCPTSARHALAERLCPERCGGACVPQLEPLVARKKSLAVLTGPHSVPLTSAQFHPPPGSRPGLYRGSWNLWPSTAPAQGPRGGRRPTPELHACPMLSVRVCSPPPWPWGLHHAASSTPPTSPLPGDMPILLFHLALAVVHCDGGVQAGEAEGLRTPLSASVLVSEPLATSVLTHVASEAPSPAFLSTALPDGRFWGGFCFSAEGKKKKKHSAL